MIKPFLICAKKKTINALIEAFVNIILQRQHSTGDFRLIRVNYSTKCRQIKR